MLHNVWRTELRGCRYLVGFVTLSNVSTRIHLRSQCAGWERGGSLIFIHGRSRRGGVLVICVVVAVIVVFVTGVMDARRGSPRNELGL